MHAVTGTGRVIAGRYRLVARLGQGAMGTVWRADDPILAREVAVKEIRLPDLPSEAERRVLRERTLREARVAAKLSHPGVVTVYDVVESEGTPWIVMELVPARSLERVLTEEGPLQPPLVAGIGAMLLDALASAHQVGIVHRDVKPGNVLITSDRRAVLTDFGIATLEGEPGLTQAGMVMGTPGFCAPERIRGEPASPASDLWSLGATLYAAVEGHPPFRSQESPMAVLASIVHSDPPPATAAGPMTSLISALMNRNPGQRPDAAAAGRMLAEARRQLRAGSAAGATTVSAAAQPSPGGPAASGLGPGPGARPAPGAGPVPRPAPGAGPVPGPAPGAGPVPGPAPGAGPVPGPDVLWTWPPRDTGNEDLTDHEHPSGRSGAGQPASNGPAPRQLTGGGPPPRQPTPGQASSPHPPGRRQQQSQTPHAPAQPPPAGFIASGAPAAAPEDGSPASTRALPAGAGQARARDTRRRTRTRPRRWPLLIAIAVIVAFAGLLAGVLLGHGRAGRQPRAGGGRNTTHEGSQLPGYRWYTGTSGTGTTRFSMAVPQDWKVSEQGIRTLVHDPSTGAIITISPTRRRPVRPRAAVRVLTRGLRASGLYPGFHTISTGSDVLHGTRADTLRFSYRGPGGASKQGLAVIARLGTAAHPQPYEFVAVAPTASWSVARDAFEAVLHTFGLQSQATSAAAGRTATASASAG